jgi:hypothetical protein
LGLSLATAVDFKGASEYERPTLLATSKHWFSDQARRIYVNEWISVTPTSHGNPLDSTRAGHGHVPGLI